MATGKIERYNSLKGLGYILPETGGPHILFTCREASRAGRYKISEGEKLEFETHTDRGGLTTAVNLKFEQPERSARIAGKLKPGL